MRCQYRTLKLQPDNRVEKRSCDKSGVRGRSERELKRDGEVDERKRLRANTRQAVSRMDKTTKCA